MLNWKCFSNQDRTLNLHHFKAVPRFAMLDL